jgi:hypothetical protein
MPRGRAIARKAEIDQRRARAIQLRIKGTTWDDIATELGYSGRGEAHNDVKRALEERSKDLADSADELRLIETANLDRLAVEAWKVLERYHPLVQSGKVVVDLSDRPLEDDGPVLAAIDRLLKISARRAALWGLDSPVRVEASGEVRYEIVGIDTSKLT